MKDENRLECKNPCFGECKNLPCHSLVLTQEEIFLCLKSLVRYRYPEEAEHIEPLLKRSDSLIEAKLESDLIEKMGSNLSDEKLIYKLGLMFEVKPCNLKNLE